MDELALKETGLDGIFSAVLGRMSIRITCDDYTILEAEDVTPETCTGIVRQVMELAAFDKTERLLQIEATGGRLPPRAKNGTGEAGKLSTTDRRKGKKSLP